MEKYHCQSVRIVFAQNCEFEESNLKFSLDERYRNVIKIFHRSADLQSFAINSNTLYYRFQYDDDDGDGLWGLRFYVIGLGNNRVLTEKQLFHLEV